MKVRKLAVALALAGGLGSSVAQALGLGEVELQSYLNEPLDAQIVLRQSRGVSPGDVFVNVAPESAYQRVGLNRDQFVSKLKFQVVTRSDGSLAVSVSSREPLREPYLNFLLELSWPSGRLLREYAVLLDPPVYAAETGRREPFVAASSGGRSSSSSRAGSGLVNRPDQSSGQRSRQGSLPSRAAGNVYGPTTSSDTLWSIASRMRPDSSVSVQQTMLAIQDLNPNAFVDSNINFMKRGEVLRIPTLAQIQQRSQSQATQAVMAQNQNASTTTRTTIDTRTAAVRSAPAAVGGDDVELKLIVAETPASQAGDQGEQTGSAGTGGSEAGGGVDGGNAVALQELASARLENSELNSRLDAMKDQVQTLQRLLELKNSQLADLQQAGLNNDGAAAAAGSNAFNGSDGSGSVDDGSGSVDDGMAATDGLDAGAEVADEPPENDAEAELAGGLAVQPQQDAESPVLESERVEEPGLLGGFVNSILNNPVFLALLGGGLLLFLLLLLLASRSKSKKQYAAATDADDTAAASNEPATSVGSFDLNLDDPQPLESETSSDLLAEVDSYLAYGQHEQAVNALESAISREPSRAELRLKLLAVYADTQNRVAFERQYGELGALNDDEATEQADRLLVSLEQAEAAPSIDDLESDLRSEPLAGLFTDVDEKEKEQPGPLPEDSIDYDLTDIKVPDEKYEPEKSKAAVETDDFVLSDDFARAFSDDSEQPLKKENDLVGKATEDGYLGLDETFLDELDAELDSEISDDDPALVDEFADMAGSTSDGAHEDIKSDALAETDDADLWSLELDEKSLADAEADEEPTDAVAGDDGISLEDLDSLDLPEEDLPAYDLPEDDVSEDGLPEDDVSEDGLPEDDVSEDDLPEDDLPVATLPAVDENDFGDDEEFDFLSGTDESATKLDLAQAYVEMGDIDGAREILQEVELEGTDEQKAEAQELLKNLS